MVKSCTAIAPFFFAVMLALCLTPSKVFAITFGNWASSQGYTPGAAMPALVSAVDAQIDTLDGIGDYNWDATERLVLDRNQITAIEPGDFSELQNLQMLFLGFNQITSIEASDFEGLENLRWLYLNSNRIESLDSDDLTRFESLEKLSLHFNLLTRIDPGSLSGPQLDALFLGANPLSSLNLTDADYSRLVDFDVGFSFGITSVSLKNSIIDQEALAALMDGGSSIPLLEGIGDLGGVTSMDLSGIDFDAITDLSPLYAMDDLTELWLVGTENLSAAGLDALLDNLDTIEGTATEGVLYMTQADFDAFNSIGGGLLSAWDAELGHHVVIVPEPTSIALLTAIAVMCIVKPQNRVFGTSCIAANCSSVRNHEVEWSEAYRVRSETLRQLSN